MFINIYISLSVSQHIEMNTQLHLIKSLLSNLIKIINPHSLHLNSITNPKIKVTNQLNICMVH